MFRRLHTTNLNCIVCDALTNLGAGKEGWLVDNPELIIFLDTHSVALANRSLILILHWSSSNNGGPDPNKNQVVKIRPDCLQLNLSTSPPTSGSSSMIKSVESSP
ncbi:hypothetical protein Fot_13391 [Forsythia ovata]|uniref:Uncharacterized protein n=1 Tax=Forsythia ovata TaxID=205694 RepID=A0ABD1W5U5_9LAMI